jgi:bis(5'-nucleosyl)-tetraphosphatase (symmetrical)
LGPTAVAVLGNHDLHLIARSFGYAKDRVDDTLDAILAAPDRVEIIDWLRTLPLLYSQGPYIVVHAGLLPQWTAEKAMVLAREVEIALQGPGHREFLAHLYGSKPDMWDDQLSGSDRLRVIVNAMTRMRFCSAGGRMDFHSKGDQGLPGQLPWFEVPGRASAGAILICGHWSALGLKLTPNLIALDAGCVWGGALTAVSLSDRKVVQVACRGDGKSAARAAR